MTERIGVFVLCVAIRATALAGPDQGLVAHWDFDEGSGNVLHDKSGNGNDGRAHGAAWVKSGKGTALRFDGVDDYVDCGGGPSLDITGPITIQAWIQPAGGAGGERGIAGKFLDSYGMTYRGWAVFSISGRRNRVRGRVEDGAWTHLAATFDGMTLCLYVNGGKMRPRKSNVKQIKAGKTFLIGGIVGDAESGDSTLRTSGHFSGLIDSVRVHDRALSQQEILHYYDSDTVGKKGIRVGLIRCDTHGLYYGTMMDRHDPILLRGPNDVVGERHHSWLSGGAYFYHYQHYAAPSRMTSPFVSGFRITKLWDEDKSVAEKTAEIFYGRPKVCDTFEEVSDDVDLVFIADCNGEGRDKLKLAAPGLKKGVPTFVDKPFAYDVKDSLAIVRLGDEHETPILSLSMLRVLPHMTRFRNRFDEVGEAQFGTIRAIAGGMGAQIHAASLAQHLFGDGVQSVDCMKGKKPLAYVHLDYGERRDRPMDGVMMHFQSGRYGPRHYHYVASAFGPEGAIHSPPVGDLEYPEGAAKVLEMCKEMVRTRKPPVPYDQIIENIAVLEAARRAEQEGRRVPLSEVWERRGP